MRCKACGAPIRKGDLRADGRCVCPGCGKVYRVKAAGAKGGRARRRRSAYRLNRAGVILVAVIAALVALALAIFLVRGGADRIKIFAPRATATAEPTTTPTIEPTAAPTPTASPSPTPTAEPTATPTPAPSVHFRAVGDVMSHQEQLYRARRGDGSYDYSPQFMYVRDALSKADYTIANLEMSIAANENYSGYPTFRIPESILDTLKDCGIDLLTNANNHTLDGFYEGLVKTIEEMDERGFAHLGTYRTAEEAAQPLVVEIHGIRFGFLAYTQEVNANSANIPAEVRPFCVKFLGNADFAADVQALRDAGAEVVICLPHWGEEGHRLVSAQCREYARRMVEAGVDIILGSHPHMVQPIEQAEMEVNGQKKDVLIAWSLGNFISNMTYPYEDCGIILDFTVTREADGRIRIHDVGYVPIYVWNSDSDFHALCPGDFIESRPDGMSDYAYNRMKATVFELGETVDREGITRLLN